MNEHLKLFILSPQTLTVPLQDGGENAGYFLEDSLKEVLNSEFFILLLLPDDFLKDGRDIFGFTLFITLCSLSDWRGLWCRSAVIFE